MGQGFRGSGLPQPPLALFRDLGLRRALSGTWGGNMGRKGHRGRAGRAREKWGPWDGDQTSSPPAAPDTSTGATPAGVSAPPPPALLGDPFCGISKTKTKPNPMLSPRLVQKGEVPDFMDGKTEAQRKKMTCPKPPGAEQGPAPPPAPAQTLPDHTAQPAVQSFWFFLFFF